MEIELISKLTDLLMTFVIIVYSFIFIIGILIFFSIINAEMLNSIKQQVEKKLRKKK